MIVLIHIQKDVIVFKHFSFKEMIDKLGQCKARPFNFHRVCFFLSMFLCFSAPTHYVFSTLTAQPLVDITMA